VFVEWEVEVVESVLRSVVEVEGGRWFCRNGEVLADMPDALDSLQVCKLSMQDCVGRL
jgi:hypothetical protein